MRVNKSLVQKLYSLVVIAICASTLFSCQLGLGGAVDTQKPELEITYPPTKSIIRDTFTMAGRVTDDIGVKTVQVTVRGTNNGRTYGPYKAIITPENTWSVDINNPLGAGVFEIQDGSYNFTVTATDGSAKSTTADVIYEIDNTAPVIAMTSPSSTIEKGKTISEVNTDTIIEYGTFVELSGSIVDDHEVPKFTFVGFDLETREKLAEQTFTNLGKSFSNEKLTEETYGLLYGDTSSEINPGTRYYRYSVYAEDEAQEYTDPQSNTGNGKGNVSTYFFMNTDLRDTLEITANDLNSNELQSYYRGKVLPQTATSASKLYEDTKGYALAGLNAITENDRTGSLKINKDNAPTYSISTIYKIQGPDKPMLPAILGTSDDWLRTQFKDNRDITNGTKFQADSFDITFKIGRDGTEFDREKILSGEDLTIYLVPFYKIENSGKRYQRNAADTGDIETVDSAAQRFAVSIPNSAVSFSSDSFRVTVSLAEQTFLRIGTLYEIQVVGQDKKGHKFNTSDIYGFLVRGSGGKPELSMDDRNPSNNGVYTDKLFSETSTIRITGKVQSKADVNVSKDIELWVESAATGGPVKSTLDTPASIPGASNSVSHQFDASGVTDFALTLSAADFFGGSADNIRNGAYTIRVMAKDQATETQVVYTDISFDKEGAKVDELSVTKVHEYDGRSNVVNGEIKLSWSTDDGTGQGVKNIYVVTDPGSKTDAQAILSPAAGPLAGTKTSTPLDTKGLSDNTEHLFRVIAEDKVGHLTHGDISVYVCQASDKPVIKLSGVQNLSGSDTPSVEKGNLFSPDSVITGSVSDDDGVRRAVVTLRNQADTSKKITKEVVSDGSSSDYELRQAVPDKTVLTALGGPGLYDVIVEAWDKNWEKDADTNNKNEETRVIGITFGTPGITFTSTVNGYCKAESEITVTGTVTNPNNGAFTVQRMDGKGLTVTGTNFTDTFKTSAEEGPHTVRYTVTDYFGESSSADFTYIVDKTAPTVGTITVPAATDTLASSLYISGESTDAGAGIGKVAVTITSGQYSKTVEDVNRANWSFKIDTRATAWSNIFSTEGVKQVSVTVTDKVDNSATETASFLYDKAAPSVTVDTTNLTGFMPKEGLSLAFTKLEDTYALGTVTVRQSINNGDVLDQVITLGTTDSTPLVTDGKETTVHIPFKKEQNGTFSNLAVTTGTYSYEVIVTDAAGHETTATAIPALISDLTPPTVAITDPKPSENHTGVNSLTQANYRFAGTASDDSSGVEKVLYKIVEHGAAEPTRPTGMYDSAWNSASGTQNWSFTQQFVAGDSASVPDGALKEGQYDLYVWAYDKAGNRADQLNTQTMKLSFDVDFAKPSVTAWWNEDTHTPLSELVSGKSLNANTWRTLVYEAYDTNGLADYTRQVLEITVDDHSGTLKTLDSSDFSVSRSGDNRVHTITINNKVDGIYTYSLRAEDVMGKQTDFTYTFTYDTKAPDVEITSPDITEWQTKRDIQIIGNAGDATGVSAVYWSVSGTIAGETPVASDFTQAKGWHLINGTTNLKFDFKLEDLPGSPVFFDGPVYFGTIDTLGNCGVTAKNLQIDPEKPVIQTTSYAGKPNSGELFVSGYTYVRKPTAAEVAADASLTDQTFTISGSVTDNYRIEDVVLGAEKGDDKILIHLDDGWNGTYEADGITKKISDLWDSENNKSYGLRVTKNPASNEWTWVFKLPFSYFDNKNGTWKFTYLLTDASGQKEEQTTNLVIDTKAPKTGSAYVQRATSSSYVKEGTDWYKSTAIKYVITGDDDTATGGSGVSTVEYSVSGNGATAEWLPMTLNDGKYVGTVNFPVTAENQGAHTVYFHLTDKAGNIAEISDSPLFDTEPPEDATCSITGELLVNGQNDLSFKVSVRDVSTGIKKVRVAQLGGLKFKTDSSDPAYIAPVTFPEADGMYALTIDKKFLGDASGSIYVEAEDNVGNTATTKLFQLNVDKTAPTVAIAAIPDADTGTPGIQVNGIITISGTANDDQKLEKVEVAYSTDNGATWTLFDGQSGRPAVTGTPHNWVVENINTKTLFSDGMAVQIRAKAFDEALNPGLSEPVTVIINQNSDRPLVSLNNFNLSGLNTAAGSEQAVYFKERTIFGNVTDDDGVESLKITYTRLDSRGNKVSSTDTKDTGTQYIELSGSSFEFKFVEEDGTAAHGPSAVNLTDGDYLLEFEIADSNTIFASSNAGTLAQPRIRGSEKGSVFNQILVKLDTVAPAIGKVSVTTNVNATSGIPDNTATWIDSDLDKIRLGGVTPKFAARFTLSDSSGIKPVSDAADNSGLIVKMTGACTYTVPAAHITTMAGTGTDEGKTVYLITDLPADQGTGSLQMVITAQDNAGAVREDTVNLNVDNTDPEVTITTGNSKYINGGGIEVINGTTEAGTALYLSLTISEDEPEGNRTSDYKDSQKQNSYTKWEQVSDASETSAYWTVYFDGKDDRLHFPVLNKYLVRLGITTNADLNTFTTPSPVYLWIKAVDRSGNESVTKKQFTIDPQGDRPSVEILYPEEPVNGIVPTIGGTQRLSGSAEDNKAVSTVWVQLVSQSHSMNGYTAPAGAAYFATGKTSATLTDIVPTWDDLMYLVAAGYDVYKYDTYASDSKVKLTADDTQPAHFDGSAYAVPADLSGGSSWSLKINSKKEFDPAAGSKNLLGMRVFALDNENNVSFASERLMEFDADNPVISSVYLVKGSDSREFSDGMFVKGRWHITGTVSDTDNISAISVIQAPSSGDPVETPVAVSGTNTTETFDVELTLLPENEGVGAVTVEILAKDSTGNSPHEGKLVGIINYDNKAPELLPQTDPECAINATVRDTNGFYTMSSVVTESAVGAVSQSGFERIAFYFTRDLNGVRTLFDPILSKNEDANQFTVTGIDDNTTSGSIRYMSGMYWKAVSVTRNAEALDKILLPAADKNIRKGGMVRVSGGDYIIIGIGEDGKELVLSGSPKMPETRAPQEVYFALAQIVDNTVMETGTGTKEIWTNSSTTGVNGYFNTIYNDDGDRMVEYVQKSGGKSHWEASICSKNISDGPITVHYIAFDKAGNYAADAVSGNVGNNMPRIAGLRLGTDNNGNGSVEPGEMLKVYSGLDKNGDIRSDVILTKDLEVNEGNSALKIKGPVQISPEIVGGNGGVGYTYTVYAESGDETKAVTTFTEFATEQSGNSEDVLRTGTDILFSRENIFEQLPNNKDKDKEKDITAKNLKYQFKIWDKTPGTTPGVNSQYATVTVLMDMAWKDEEKPKAAIKPFYWKNIHDNSIYGSSFTDETGEYVLEDWSGLNGHIELENDLPDAIFKATNTGIWDLDPKVSGWITIEGTASDDNVVSEILLKITDASGNDVGLGTDFFTIADRSSGSLAGPAGHTFDPDSRPAIWSFEAAADDFTTESGNQVTWKFHWNTAKITRAVGKDIRIEVKVKDKGTLSKDGSYSDQSESEDIAGITSEGKLTTHYQVDVVPYIQSITTWLSDLNPLNPTEYSRTAQGHYPVMDKADRSKSTISDETIAINGFNLDESGTTMISKSVKDISGSGEFTVTVNGIESLNNKNAHSKEDETGKTVKIEYNLQSNGSNNLLLTDDVILDVWTINDRAVEGIGGSIKNPAMGINPNNGQIGFAFASEKYFSMPDSTNSFNYWAASGGSLNVPAFAYDSKGYTFGVVSGSAVTDDTENDIHIADNFMMYMEKLGIGQRTAAGTMSGIGGYRLEKIGFKEENLYSTNQSRIQSPSLVTNNGELFLIYSDVMTNQIRFKSGHVLGEELLIAYSSENNPNTWYYNRVFITPSTAQFDAASVNDSTITYRLETTLDGTTYKSPFVSGKYLKLNGDFYQIQSSSYEEEGSAVGKKYTVSIKLTTGLKSDLSKTTSTQNNQDLDIWKVYSLQPQPFGYFVDQFTDENMVEDSTDNVQVITSTTAGKYVSMDIIPTGATGAGSLVAVWYDQTAKKLMYSYNTDPTSLDGTGTKPNGNWGTEKAIMSNGGEYCQVKVDAAGGIHIVCFGTGGIKYGYAASYTATPTFVTVDSGERKALDLSLDVVKNAEGRIVPYISYYCASQYLPKMAYPVVTAEFDGKTKNGMENSRYTGAWEIAIIPTTSDVQRDNVNVALWKDAGVQKASTAGTSTYTHTVDAEKSVSYGQVYGNGTSNPVVSYVTNDGAKGYIETAQMR